MMMSLLRRPTVRPGAAGWLLAGTLACSPAGAPDPAAVAPEPGDGAAAADRVPPASDDDARAGELAAEYALEVATEADRRRAEQGDADAQALLGVVYYNGRGVDVDHEEGVRWARLAAEQGNARGQSLLGAAYYSGNGVPQDHGEAARWTRLAVEGGNVSAQLLLGIMYLQGHGVPQDDFSAYLWMTIAARDGAVGGTERTRDMIARRMTPEQVEEAQAQARDWNE